MSPQFPNPQPPPLPQEVTASGGQEKQQSDYPIIPEGDKLGDGAKATRAVAPHPSRPGPKPGLTLRTDTRKMQGSSRPVAGLALILHTKVNRFRHRTQFSCTSSLQARQTGELGCRPTPRDQEGQGSPLGRQTGGGEEGRERSLFTLYHKVTAVS